MSAAFEHFVISPRTLDWSIVVIISRSLKDIDPLSHKSRPRWTPDRVTRIGDSKKPILNNLRHMYGLGIDKTKAWG